MPSSVRDPWLWAVVAASLVVAGLRLLSWDDVGSPLQVAMQVAMPVPLVLGAIACIRKTPGAKAWLWPAGLFLIGSGAVGYAWIDYEGQPGEESCDAKGFLPEEWGTALEPAAAPLIFVAGAALIAGSLAAARPSSRWLGIWMLAAALALAAEWFALPVCMGT